MRPAILTALILAVLPSQAASSSLVPNEEARMTCKQVNSCEEAVILWCNGYSRADGDNDGIPCENVCRSVKQVNAIRRQIGC